MVPQESPLLYAKTLSTAKNAKLKRWLFKLPCCLQVWCEAHEAAAGCQHCCRTSAGAAQQAGGYARDAGGGCGRWFGAAVTPGGQVSSMGTMGCFEGERGDRQGEQHGGDAGEGARERHQRGGWGQMPCGRQSVGRVETHISISPSMLHKHPADKPGQTQTSQTLTSAPGLHSSAMHQAQKTCHRLCAHHTACMYSRQAATPTSACNVCAHRGTLHCAWSIQQHTPLTADGLHVP